MAHWEDWHKVIPRRPLFSDIHSFFSDVEQMQKEFLAFYSSLEQGDLTKDDLRVLDQILMRYYNFHLKRLLLRLSLLGFEHHTKATIQAFVKNTLDSNILVFVRAVVAHDVTKAQKACLNVNLSIQKLLDLLHQGGAEA